jgi:uncharacterized protein YggE
MKLARLALLCSAIAVAVAFAGVLGLGGASGDTTPTTTAQSESAITVSGVGTVTTTPNRADFDFGVTTHGTTAAQAMTANASEMQRVIAALKTAGIHADAIQTSAISLSPVTNDSGTDITGYTASNSVSVTVSALGSAGKVVDTAVAAGANEVDGPNLTAADQDSLYRAALTAAVADARAKAQALAAAGGVHVGAVQSIQEDDATSPVVYDARGATPSPTSTPVEVGSQQITASVTVSFAVS